MSKLSRKIKGSLNAKQKHSCHFSLLMLVPENEKRLFLTLFFFFLMHSCNTVVFGVKLLIVMLETQTVHANLLMALYQTSESHCRDIFENLASFCSDKVTDSSGKEILVSREAGGLANLLGLQFGF